LQPILNRYAGALAQLPRKRLRAVSGCGQPRRQMGRNRSVPHAPHNLAPVQASSRAEPDLGRESAGADRSSILVGSTRESGSAVQTSFSTGNVRPSGTADQTTFSLGRTRVAGVGEATEFAAGNVRLSGARDRSTFSAGSVRASGTGDQTTLVASLDFPDNKSIGRSFSATPAAMVDLDSASDTSRLLQRCDASQSSQLRRDSTGMTSRVAEPEFVQRDEAGGPAQGSVAFRGAPETVQPRRWRHGSEGGYASRTTREVGAAETWGWENQESDADVIRAVAAEAASIQQRASQVRAKQIAAQRQEVARRAVAAACGLSPREESETKRAFAELSWMDMETRSHTPSQAGTRPGSRARNRHWIPVDLRPGDATTGRVTSPSKSPRSLEDLRQDIAQVRVVLDAKPRRADPGARRLAHLQSLATHILHHPESLRDARDAQLRRCASAAEVQFGRH